MSLGWTSSMPQGRRFTTHVRCSRAWRVRGGQSSPALYAFVLFCLGLTQCSIRRSSRSYFTNCGLAEVKEGKVRAHLEKVIALVELAVNQPHTYIKFIGD